jgi:hypothetical protein
MMVVLLPTIFLLVLVSISILLDSHDVDMLYVLYLAMLLTTSNLPIRIVLSNKILFYHVDLLSHTSILSLVLEILVVLSMHNLYILYSFPSFLTPLSFPCYFPLLLLVLLECV